MKRLELKTLILVLAWVALVQPAFAEWAPSKAEMRALPPYCAARWDDKSEAFKSWRATMGSDFNHIHHYCAGLNFVNRAHGMASQKDREGTLSAAVRNFDYILTHTQQGFYLRPEDLMNRGIALTMMQKPGEAIGNLLKAIEMNPKLTRAYLSLSEIYEKQKSNIKALEIVTEGLRHNPDTKSMQRRYTKLGGKLPYPSPNEPVVVETPNVAPSVSAVPSPAATEPKLDTPVEASPAEESAAQPKIGSPKNPYCRFCPD